MKSAFWIICTEKADQVFQNLDQLYLTSILDTCQQIQLNSDFFYHHGNPNIAGWIDLLHQKLSLNVQVTFWFENKETSCQFSVWHMAWSEKKSAHETICIVIFKRSGCYKETGSIVLQNTLDSWSLSLPPFVTLESDPNWVHNNWIGTQWQLTYPQCSCRRLSAFRFFNFRSLMLPIDLACVYIHLTSFCSGG